MNSGRFKYDDKAKMNANISQIKDFGSSQFLQWRVVTLLSIKKILSNIENFADDSFLEFIPNEVDKESLRYNQIRNGFIYEAVSQSIQGIEEMFALIKNSRKWHQLTKNHINYPAGQIKSYVKKGSWGKEEYVIKEFGLPKLSEDNCDAEALSSYKHALDFLIESLKEIKSFYLRYIQCYNQYKHGLKVGMRPFGYDTVSAERISGIKKCPLKGSLYVFSNNLKGDLKDKETTPAIAINMTPYTQPFLDKMEKEKNLLAYVIEQFDVQNAVDIAIKAASITAAVWSNIDYRIKEYEEKGTVKKYVFPTDDMFRQMIITITTEKNADIKANL